MLQNQVDQLSFLEDSSKNLLLMALKTAHGTGAQAEKATGLVTEGTKSLAAGGLAISRRNLLAAAVLGAVGGAGKKISEDAVEELGVGEAFGRWIKENAASVRKLFADDPADMRGAIDQLLKGIEAEDDVTDI